MSQLSALVEHASLIPANARRWQTGQTGAFQAASISGRMWGNLTRAAWPKRAFRTSRASLFKGRDDFTRLGLPFVGQSMKSRSRLPDGTCKRHAIAVSPGRRDLLVRLTIGNPASLP